MSRHVKAVAGSGFNATPTGKRMRQLRRMLQAAVRECLAALGLGRELTPFWASAGRAIAGLRPSATGRRRNRRLGRYVGCLAEGLEPRLLMTTTLYWDTSASSGLQGGSGTWSTSATNWNTAADGSGSRVAWTNGDDAVFSASGGTVTILGGVTADSVTFSNTGYMVSSSTLTLTGTASVTGSDSATVYSSISGSPIFDGTILFHGVASGNATFNNSSANYGTITGDATFNDSSQNYGTIDGNATFASGSSGTITLTGSMSWSGEVIGTVKGGDGVAITTWIFDDHTDIPGAITGDAVFNDYSENIGTITGSATFNDNTYNNSTVTGDAAFSGYAHNYGPVGGVAVFNDSSQNDATVSGDATFNDSSFNSSYGTISGNATFNGNDYSDATVFNPQQGTVGGTVTFSATPPVTFTLSGDDEWDVDASTWTFAATPQWIFDGSSQNRGTIAGNSTFNDTTFNMSTVTGDAVFNDEGNNYGTVNGEAVFNGSGGNSGSVSGIATFNDGTVNWGAVDGQAVFNGTSCNYYYSTITGDAAFNDTNNDGTVYGDAAFTGDSSYAGGWNNGTVTGNAAFDNFSLNVGAVGGNAAFNNSSWNDGAVSGSAAFDASYNYASVDGDAAFNDDSLNWSTVSGDAAFDGGSANYGTVYGNAVFDSTSANDGTITGSAHFESGSDGTITLTGSTEWDGAVDGDISDAEGNPITHWIFDDTSTNNGTITGDAIFNDDSSNEGTITGNAIFNDDSQNDATIIGNAGFNDSSFNNGPVIGNATFGYGSDGTITLTGTMEWNGTVVGQILGSDSAPITQWVFNDSSTNAGAITGDAVFNDSSANDGSVYFDHDVDLSGRTLPGGTFYIESGVTAAYSGGLTLADGTTLVNYGTIDWADSDHSQISDISNYGAIIFPPTVDTAAAVSSSPVTTTTASLSVLGADDTGGESGLTYTWAQTSEPGGASPTFSDNGDNSAKDTTVTFNKPGDYTFQVTITNPSGLSITSSVDVTVELAVGSIKLSPTATVVGVGDTTVFIAAANDQFGQPFSTTFSWSLEGSPYGTVSLASDSWAAYTGVTAGTDTLSVSAGGVTQTATVAVSGTDPGTTTPTISSFTAAASGDAAIHLTWSADDSGGPGIDQYELTRDGQPLETLAGTDSSYYDTNLTAGVTYTYGLVAVDVDGNASTESDTSEAPAADDTPPSAPVNVTVTAVTSSSITFTWAAASDNVGVVGYHVYDGGDTLVDTVTDPSDLTYTATGLTANTTYAYYVSAYDAAGNGGHYYDGSAISATTLPSTPTTTNTINDQYIPPAFEDYFYNTMEAKLRQLELETGTFSDGTVYVDGDYGGANALVPTARWLDPFSPVIANGELLEGLPYGSSLEYYDANENARFDPGEFAWEGGGSGYYYSGGTTITPDATAPAYGATGYAPIFYIPSSSTEGDWHSGDYFFHDPYQIEGVQNVVSYYDVNGTGQWASNDPIWYDSGGNATYQYGDAIIYDPNGLLTEANSGKLLGKKNGLNIYDPVSPSATAWIPEDGPIVWADSTTFQQDFANFYAQLDNVVAASGDGTNDLAALLADVGGVATGTITISSGVVTDSSGQLAPGAFINTGSGWDQLYAYGDAGLQEYGETDYSGSVEITGWTVIPDATVDGISFSAVYGDPSGGGDGGYYGPGYTGPIFAQQFQELDTVMSDLTDMPIPLSDGYTEVDLGSVPSGDIPLTTEMNDRNVVPDSNLDGIVNVPQDITSFGNDTGMMGFTVDQDTPQVDIPLYTNDYGELPVNGYLEQGAFAASSTDSDTSPLLSAPSIVPADTEQGWAYAGWTGPDVSGDGTPYAYSLNTSVQNVLLIDDGSNHVKEVQVTRPGGNAVLFNFAWDSDTNEFSQFGLPTGINASNTYVLVDNTPTDDTDLSYNLEFADGTVQEFGAGDGEFESGAGDGSLQAITNTATGQTVFMTASLEFDGFGTPLAIVTSSDDGAPPFNEPTGSTEPTYTTTITWANGQISTVAYKADAGSEGQSARTITTTLQYDTDDAPAAGGNGGLIDQLLKDETTSGTPAAINAFSYAYDPESNTITENTNTSLEEQTTSGTTWTRGGSVASGTVTLTMTLDGATGTTSTEYHLNSAGLITAEIVTHDDGLDNDNSTTTAETDTTYIADYSADEGGITQDSTDRYSGNMAAEWGQVSTITNPDGSWEAFTYNNPDLSSSDPANAGGWLYQAVTPFQGTTLESLDGDYGGDADVNISTYMYDPSLSGGGDPVNPLALVERPREITSTTQGVAAGILFMQYAGAAISTRQAATADGTWDTATMDTSSELNTYGPADTTSADGDMNYDTWIDSSGNELIVADATTDGSGGTWVSETDETINPFGNVIYSQTTDELSGLVTDEMTTTTDAFGRILTTDTDDGLDAVNTSGVTTSADYSGDTWFGPDSTTDMYGSVTDYTYTDYGAIQSRSTNGITDTYAYDDSGNPISDTESGTFGGGSGDDVTTSQTFDAQGRTTSYTDALGDVTATVYTTGSDTYGDTNIATSTETAIEDSSVSSATYIQTTYIDGSMDSVSGTSQDGTTTYAEGVSAYTPGAGTSPGSGGLFSETISPGGAADYSYYNLLGQNYLSTQPAPDSGVDSSWSFFDASGVPVWSTGFDGSVDSVRINPLYGGVSSSQTKLDGSTTAISTTSQGTSLVGGIPVHVGITTDNGGGSPSSVTADETSDDGLWNKQVGPDGTATTQTTLGSDGGWTTTTYNADGTQTEDIYAGERLSEEVQIATDGSTVISTVEYGYDYLGRLESMTDSTGTTTYVLRADGSISETDYPDDTSQIVLSWDDLNGRPTEVQNRDGSDSYTDYNAAGEVIDSYGDQTTPTSQTQNNTTGTDTLTTYTGPGMTGTAATTTWQYDPATGLLEYKQYADESEDTYSYNADNQLQYIDEPGFEAETAFTYDAGGLLQTADYGGGSGYDGGVSYTVNSRDGSGNILSDTQVEGDNTLTNTYAYTADGQLQSETFANISEDASVSYTYDGPGDTSPGSLSTMAFNFGDSQLVGTSYSYSNSDGSQRLYSQTDTINEQSFTYGYLSDTNLVSSLATTGVTTTTGYDGDDRVDSIVSVNSDDDTVYAQYITYTSLNQVYTRTTTQATSFDEDGTPSYTTQELQYTYDSLGQLTAITDITDPESPVVDESYSYDALGNRTDTGFASNDLNQYTSIPNPLGAGTVTPTYNDRGDLTYDGLFNYTYDTEDRMTSAEAVDHSKMALYSYDAQNRLISETVLRDYDSDTSTYEDSTTTNFAYAGDELIAELDGGGDLLRSYQWGAQGINGKVGALLSVTDYTGESPVTYNVVNDSSGNVVALLNADGDTMATYTYTAQGVRTAIGPAAGVCNIGTDGSYLDPITGNTFADNRVQSWLGIWMQRDPSGESSDPNLYRVDGNNQINFSDPTGLLAGAPGASPAAPPTAAPGTGGGGPNYPGGPAAAIISWIRVAQVYGDIIVQRATDQSYIDQTDQNTDAQYWAQTERAFHAAEKRAAARRAAAAAAATTRPAPTTEPSGEPASATEPASTEPSPGPRLGADTQPAQAPEPREPEPAAPQPDTQPAGTAGPASDDAAEGGANLPADAQQALDDIEQGAARPNVRNPKPFANDGRGGTPQLPTQDAAGNPINYTEHTVNPRPPGGSLDGQRIITGSDGSVWYTNDHFTTWTRVK